MVNYDKSIIYKLCCKDTSITYEYIGSTVNFTRRKSNHKSNCCNENGIKYNLNVYKFIRENGGWYNWDMVEVERYCATDRKDLHSRERFWLEELGATLNKNIPSRSSVEYKSKYYQENKERFYEYRQQNKDRIKKNNLKYYLI